MSFDVLKVFVTKHAVDRLKTRFGASMPKDFKWKIGDRITPKEIDLFQKLFSESTESRTFLNDSMFMMSQYERHGYDALFKFLVHPIGMIFVLVEKDSRWICTTVLSSGMEHVPVVKKKAKVQKKEKSQDAIYQSFDDKFLSSNPDLYYNKRLFIESDENKIDVCASEKKRLYSLVADGMAPLEEKISNSRSIYDFGSRYGKMLMVKTTKGDLKFYKVT